MLTRFMLRTRMMCINPVVIRIIRFWEYLQLDLTLLLPQKYALIYVIFYHIKLQIIRTISLNS